MPPLPYQLRLSRSHRRSIRLAVHADGSIVVTASPSIPRSLIEAFIERKSSWLQRKIQERGESMHATLKGDREEFLMLRDLAHDFAKERLEEICKHMGVSYQTLTIRNTNSRWGSCSRRRNLSIHYKILFLPLDIAEYLLVHEVCHLKEMNHGVRFWRHVAQRCPDFLVQRRALRRWIKTAESIRL